MNLSTLLKKNLKIIIFIFIAIFLIIFTYNDYDLYSDTIIKVINTKEEYVSTEEVTFGYKESIYNEEIEARIMNGEYKGEIVKFNNEYHKGEAYDQRYAIGDELFVSLYVKNDRIKRVNIDGYKRDKYIVLLILLFVFIIVLVGHLKGLLSVFSVAINIILFCFLIHINAIRSIGLVPLSFMVAILYSIVSLTLVSGVNKKTLSAIISSILGVILIFIISFIVIKITNYSGIRFDQMELLTRPYEEIFISEIILGGLGAIMDISISISSSLNELIEKNKRISVKALRKSGFNIGQDIMGTMINVLFFTYICTGISNLVIFFRNGVSIANLMTEYISLEMTRALTGAIGIVITIPISIYVSLYIYKRRAK